MAIAKLKRLIFTVFACIRSPPADFNLFQLFAISGSEKPQRTIWKLFANRKLANSTLISDKAYPAPDLKQWLKDQNTELITQIKKPKGKELTPEQKKYNKMISRLRQPIESLFNWINEKTKIQTADKVRSTDGLMVHCFGKLTFAMLFLVFNY